MKSKTGTVYLVDDDPSMRRALVRLVESLQLKARAFGSAGEFLKVLPLNTWSQACSTKVLWTLMESRVASGGHLRL